MRFIDNTNLEVDEKWLRKTQKALDDARQKSEDRERKEYINSKSSIWVEVKPELEELSNKKCWYCEAYEKRSDRSVDHFRPKNNVRDTEHNGYWWLAFRKDNYRLSCTYCNTRRCDRETGNLGGKGDYFPLWDESKRVYNEADDGKCKYEDPLLLDPCKISDVGLLWFTEDGRAIPKHGEDENKRAYIRASDSIDKYHLNEKEIKEARQGLYKTIEDYIKDGDFHFEDSLFGNPNAERALGSTIEELAKLISSDAEYSGFSLSIIAGFRSSGREWLDTIYLIN